MGDTTQMMKDLDAISAKYDAIEADLAKIKDELARLDHS